MSASEREWMAATDPRGSRGIKDWSVTNWLIAINAAVFLLNSFWQIGPQKNPVGIPFLYGFYSVDTCWNMGEYWRLITYQFLHASVGHILFNMFALYFFGTLMERVMGKGRYLVFYFLSGIAGALFSSLLALCGMFDKGEALANWSVVPMVGASGAIYGILTAGAFIFPKAKVQLVFPPVTLTMRALALVLLGIGVFIIIFNWENAGGEAGHIGGMIMGALLISMPFFRYSPVRKRKLSTLEEIDRILDKISAQGMDSLSHEERAFIDRASREKNI